jgi:hypothetical protein
MFCFQKLKVCLAEVYRYMEKIVKSKIVLIVKHKFIEPRTSEKAQKG